jgi:hypothetical protein
MHYKTCPIILEQHSFPFTSQKPHDVCVVVLNVCTSSLSIVRGFIG